MSMTKFASFEVSEVLEVKGSPKRLKTASLDKVSDYSDFRTSDGYMYVRLRAISSRVNKNHDGWPSVELAGSPEIFDRHQGSSSFTITANDELVPRDEKGKAKFGFATFLGKPIFVDHNNSDPKRGRGVIVDSKFNVLDHKTAAADDKYWNGDNVDPEHLPAAEVELLLEVDAKSFPMLAKAIENDDIDGFSMGCDVEKTICNICSNEAHSPQDFCDHVRLKGATFDYRDSKTGTRTSKKSYENCYGIKFFEISAVFDPADETALKREIIREGSTQMSPLQAKAASAKLADNPTPQSELTKAPEDVDTLRKEQVCKVCGADMDSGKCEVCGHEEPPEGLNTPNLEKAHDFDVQEQTAESPADQLGEVPPGSDGPQSPLEARNPQVAASVTSEMRDWQPKVHPKLAGRINTTERPIQPVQTPATDEPRETVIKDEPQPVTSSTRSAADLIAAAGQTQQENSMSDTNRVAAEPADPSGKPDKRVDVTGTGAVYPGANAEDASKPEDKNGNPGTGKRVDVEGKGGIIQDSNAEAAKADERVSLGDRQQDNAGFQEGGKTGPPTKTWSENNGVSAVSDKAFPTASAHEAAKEGVKPNGGPDVQPQRRENLEQAAPPVQTQDGTDQWTGTGGNGVTRQADPVTKKVDPNIEQPKKSGITSHVVNVFKLADTEIALGITDPAQKYERVAELEDQDELEIEARLDTLSRVKTAGLGRQASVNVQRLPSLKREAAVEPTEKTSKLDDKRYDMATFGL